MAPQLSGPTGSLTSVAYNEETAKTRYAQTVSGKPSSLTLFAFGGNKWGSFRGLHRKHLGQPPMKLGTVPSLLQQDLVQRYHGKNREPHGTNYLYALMT